MISQTDIDAMTETPERQEAAAIAEATQITMTYRNWRGEVSQRTIRPVALWFGRTDWHPEPGWLLTAWDCDKGDRRDFALADCQFADIARPSQAGVIRPLCWIDDTESKCTRAYAPALGGKMMVVELDPGSGEYSAGIDLSGLCFRFVLDTYHDGLGAFTAPAKFPSIEAAKSAAQADYEARVSSSLVETVGVDALVSFARQFANALDIECDFMTPPAPFEDGFDVRRRARAALAAMDTPKGGGDA